MTTAEIERHTTPDGAFTLVVLREADGDLSVGFEGFAGHTHGDILAELHGGTAESAIRSYVDSILSSQEVIVISRVAGAISDVWITDDPN